MARKTKKELIEQYKDELKHSKYLISESCKNSIKEAKLSTNEEIKYLIKTLRHENSKMIILLKSNEAHK